MASILSEIEDNDIEYKVLFIYMLLKKSGILSKYTQDICFEAHDIHIMVFNEINITKHFKYMTTCKVSTTNEEITSKLRSELSDPITFTPISLVPILHPNVNADKKQHCCEGIIVNPKSKNSGGQCGRICNNNIGDHWYCGYHKHNK